MGVHNAAFGTFAGTRVPSGICSMGMSNRFEVAVTGLGIAYVM